MKQEKNTAIVLAAGQGKRMNSRIQKQFLESDHRPVLYSSLECFQKSPLIQDIILVRNDTIPSIRDFLPARTVIMFLYMMEQDRL